MAPGKKVPKQREKPALRVLGSYGLALLALRKRKGMRQADIIASAKVAPRTASGAENSENVTLAVLDSLLAAMGANVVDFAVALAEVQGGAVLDAAQALRRDRVQREFAAGTLSTPTGADDLERRKLQDRIDDLETRLYGQLAVRRAASKEGPVER